MNPLFTNIHAVFFDAVGTLIVPEPPVAEVYADCAKRHGFAISPAQIALRFRDAFRAEEEIDRGAGWSSREEREFRRWRNIVGRVFHDCGTDSQIEICFAELYAHFGKSSAWRPAPDAGITLAVLANRGLILGVASNFDRRLHPVLDGMPEFASLRHRVISSEVGFRKPNQQFFAAVVARCGCEARQILFVGDDFANDYDGANSAGLQGVLLDGSSRMDTDVRRIRHLAELR